MCEFGSSQLYSLNWILSIGFFHFASGGPNWGPFPTILTCVSTSVKSESDFNSNAIAVERSPGDLPKEILYMGRAKSRGSSIPREDAYANAAGHAATQSVHAVALQ